MDATKAGGLPNANIPNGIDHVSYRMSLLNEQAMLLTALSKLDGAWEVTSEMSA